MSSPTSKAKKRSVLQQVVRFFSSYALATIVLIFMTLLTLLGTLEQVEYGLYDTQKKYFDSLFVVHEFFGVIPVPLPGVYLLMALLFINMLIGAIIKARKSWKTPGMLIAHFGMLLLIVSGFVTFHYSTNGNMALFEGEESQRFESYYDWQLEIIPVDEEGNGTKAMVVPAKQLRSIRPDQQRVFKSAELPFDIVVNGYARNAVPVPVSAPIAKGVVAKEVDGYLVLPQKDAKTAERNMGAFYAEFRGEGSESEPVEAIFWAGAADPFTLEWEGQTYAIQLVREKWDVPFTIRLDDFTMERHPGIMTARNYESTVTKIEDGTEEKIEIKMNEPLRHKGYTFFQASWGPEDAGPDDRLYSVFAVVKNPADQWPLYSLIVTTIGLCIHFVQKLVWHIVRMQKKRAKSASPTPAPASA